MTTQNAIRLLNIIATVGALWITGCASNLSVIDTFDQAGHRTSHIESSTTTVFDSQADLARSRVGIGTNGTNIFVSGLNESASSSNLLQELQIIAPMLK